MYKAMPYLMTLIYLAVNFLCLYKFVNHELMDVHFILFFIFSTFITWLCISLMEERQDV